MEFQFEGPSKYRKLSINNLIVVKPIIMLKQYFEYQDGSKQSALFDIFGLSRYQGRRKTETNALYQGKTFTHVEGCLFRP